MKHGKSLSDVKFMTDVVSLSNSGDAWANTYSKHLVALYYALNFFEGDDGAILLKHLMNKGHIKRKVSIRDARQKIYEITKLD